jgi:aspartate racemase
MSEKVIGILGGMGPEATLECYSKIIKSTPAKTDQEHLRVIIDANPKVPDRTAAIIGQGESPLTILVEGCRCLQRAGADFIIIPCVSAHFFLDEIQQQIKLPILSIFDTISETISTEHTEIKTIGLMGTTGTIRGGFLQKRLATDGINTIVPDEKHQSKVMAAIYDIKNSQSARSEEEFTSDLIATAESLISTGAQGIIAGCTEIPLALKQKHLAVPYFDALAILARAAILKAGLIPIS